MKSANDFKLTGNVTVGELKKWIKKGDQESKSNIIKLIRHRFTNRYTKHLRKLDSGFLIMAVSCLTIETPESFKQGKKDTKGIGPKIFKDFFESEKDIFPEFREFHDDFYISIRCGILHQAETTNAWRIRLDDVLFDRNNKVINARKFAAALENAIEKYISELKANDLESKI